MPTCGAWAYSELSTYILPPYYTTNSWKTHPDSSVFRTPWTYRRRTYPIPLTLIYIPYYTTKFQKTHSERQCDNPLFTITPLLYYATKYAKTHSVSALFWGYFKRVWGVFIPYLHIIPTTLLYHKIRKNTLCFSPILRLFPPLWGRSFSIVGVYACKISSF